MKKFMAFLFGLLPAFLQYNIMYKITLHNYAVNNYNENYRTRERELHEIEQQIILEFINRLHRDKPIVLDVGCGNGALYDTFLVNNGCEIVGIDMSPRQIEAAKKILPNQVWLTGDFTKFHSETKFDGIVSFYSFYNMPRRIHKKVLRKMYNLLKPGGRMLINVRVKGVGNFDYWESWCGAPLVFSYYDCKKFKMLAEDVGFNVAEFEDTPHEEYRWLMLIKGE